MSIRALIQQHIDDGRMVLWESEMRGDAAGRTLLLTRQIAEELESANWDDPALAQRYGLLQLDFSRFSRGDTIAVAMSPYEKGGNAFLARIDPVEYGMWSMRSKPPSPTIRVIGGFAEVDVFVALDSRPREMLDGPGGRKWAAFREDALARWADLFPGYHPATGTRIEDFVSEETYAV